MFLRLVSAEDVLEAPAAPIDIAVLATEFDTAPAPASTAAALGILDPTKPAFWLRPLKVAWVSWGRAAPPSRIDWARHQWMDNPIAKTVMFIISSNIIYLRSVRYLFLGI